MTSDRTPDRDERLALALGLLPPDREAEVRAAVEAHPQWQADLYTDEAALVALLGDLDLSAASIPEDAGARLLARLHAEDAADASAGLPLTPASESASSVPAVPAPASSVTAARVPKRGAWLLPLLGLAAALALAFVLRPPADLPTRYAQTPGAVRQAIVTPGGSLGTLTRLPDGRAFVHLTRPLEAGRSYQLWQLEDGVPRSLGVFGGSGLLTGPLPVGATLAVTVEPPGGSPAPTAEPLFAQTV